MKKWIFGVLALLIWGVASAQNQSDSTQVVKERRAKIYTFDELIEKYGSQEGFRSVVFGRKMMQMMADRVKHEDRELSNLLKGIHTIKTLSTTVPCPEFVEDMKRWPQSRSHISLVSEVEENGVWTSCYLVDGGRWNVSTFFLCTYGGSDEAALLITGYFSVKDISRLSAIRPN